MVFQGGVSAIVGFLGCPGKEVCHCKLSELKNANSKRRVFERKGPNFASPCPEGSL